jgi:hypothetical protein
LELLRSHVGRYGDVVMRMFEIASRIFLIGAAILALADLDCRLAGARVALARRVRALRLQERQYGRLLCATFGLIGLRCCYFGMRVHMRGQTLERLIRFCLACQRTHRTHSAAPCMLDCARFSGVDGEE